MSLWLVTFTAARRETLHGIPRSDLKNEPASTDLLSSDKDSCSVLGVFPHVWALVRGVPGDCYILPHLMHPSRITREPLFYLSRDTRKRLHAMHFI